MLTVSDLPDIIFVRLGDAIPVWIIWAKIIFLTAFLISTIASFRLRPLRHYAMVLLTLFAALKLISYIQSSEWFQINYNYSGVPFFTGYAAVMTLDVFVALAVIAVLLVIKRDRKSFFFVKGKMDAPIGPVRWLGIKDGESWKTFGWIFNNHSCSCCFYSDDTQHCTFKRGHTARSSAPAGCRTHCSGECLHRRSLLPGQYSIHFA
ncbi:MAG: hypothetical protein JXA06_08960 [Bacteroidetes bacterium]|nr:hypothetical protein [Bacteroidota bacterium]